MAGQSHSSLLSAWLKVPLNWFQSETQSKFEDEQSHHIAKTFTHPSRPSCQRKFCGFCGTHISYWTEEPIDEQDFMNITLGSLRSKDLHSLEELEILPGDIELTKVIDDDDEDRSVAKQSNTIKISRSGQQGGFKWFEDMIEGSQLGYHSSRRKGHGQTEDGTTVSWEISEVYNEEETPSSSKRRKVEKGDEAMDD